MRIKKLMLKLLDEEDGKVKWFHLCYIGSKIYNTFLQTMNIDSVEFADYIADWFKEDFGIDMTMTTRRDLNILRATVKEKYRVLYPTIYNNTDIDTHGWMRVWITQKIEKELKNA